MNLMLTPPETPEANDPDANLGRAHFLQVFLSQR